jgi:DNA primase
MAAFKNQRLDAAREPPSFTCIDDFKKLISTATLCERYDIVLRPIGSAHLGGFCPLHGDATPTFLAWVGSNRGSFCFGCGAGGDQLMLIKLYGNLPAAEAVARMCEFAKTKEVRPPNNVSKRFAAAPKVWTLDAREPLTAALQADKGNEGRKYPKSRGLDHEEFRAARKFKLGFRDRNSDEPELISA